MNDQHVCQYLQCLSWKRSSTLALPPQGQVAGGKPLERLAALEGPAAPSFTASEHGFPSHAWMLPQLVQKGFLGVPLPPAAGQLVP